LREEGEARRQDCELRKNGVIHLNDINTPVLMVLLLVREREESKRNVR
jgi:hypothetical protein